MTGAPRGRPPATDRRAQIVAAAREVMSERGFAQASLKQIAARAGIAPGLLSYYYPAKDALLVDVVAAVDAEIVERWLAAMASVDDPLERIAAGFDQAVRDCLERPEFFRLLVDLFAVGSASDAVRERVKRLLDNLVGVVAEEVAKVERALPAPLPHGIDLAGAMTAAFTGIVLHAVTREIDPAPAFGALKEMVLSLAAMSYVTGGAPAR